MGAKKNGMLIMKGSLQQHWIRYVTELNMSINPTDNHSVSMGNQMLNTLSKINSQFIQPGFTFQHKFMNNKTMKYTDQSCLELKFVNGTEKKYHMGMSDWGNIAFELEVINDLIEFERNLAGNDDELDDDFIP